MTTLFLLLLAVACIASISMTINGYSKMNYKSKLNSTNSGYLEARQGLIEALIVPSATVKEKPVSNLRGVKNKRFRKK